jgi:hypothetical protein
MSNNKIKHLLDTAYKTDSIAKNKWRIENREQLREQRKKELKELMEKDKTMSNNKQSMKLYTQEQVIEVFEKYGNMSAINARNIIDLSESIELPSDEEIREWAEMQSLGEPTGAEEFGRIYGAKWMRDLVQGGNK